MIFLLFFPCAFRASSEVIRGVEAAVTHELEATLTQIKFDDELGIRPMLGSVVGFLFPSSRRAGLAPRKRSHTAAKQRQLSAIRPLAASVARIVKAQAFLVQSDVVEKHLHVAPPFRNFFFRHFLNVLEKFKNL